MEQREEAEPLRIARPFPLRADRRKSPGKKPGFRAFPGPKRENQITGKAGDRSPERFGDTVKKFRNINGFLLQ